MHIYLYVEWIEDDVGLLSHLVYLLEYGGYNADCAYSCVASMSENIN